MPTTAELTSASERLYRYILEHHWHAPVVAGPDPRIRWNARIGRFVKSYASFVNWRDDLVYAQAQKYWIQANPLISDIGLESGIGGRRIAVECAEYLHDARTPEGYWEYPNREWSGRIATVEGNYAAIGLLLTYERTGAEPLLGAARRWYEYTVSDIGFQLRGRTLAINYLGNVPGGSVPNNTASTVRVYAMLAAATGDDRHLEYCRPMLEFMADAQVDTGELPYAIFGVTGGERPHFLCYQYNAFQFLNVCDYWRLTTDDRAEPILRRLAGYLEGGLADIGAALYDCSNNVPEVVYHGAAIGVALREATDAGFGDHDELIDRAFARVLAYQRDDGSSRTHSRITSMRVTGAAAPLHEHDFHPSPHRGYASAQQRRRHGHVISQSFPGRTLRRERRSRQTTRRGTQSTVPIDRRNPLNDTREAR